MRLLASWSNCERCDRAERRLGVLAAQWPKAVKIVVLATSADRAAQAIGELPPGVRRVVEELQDVLKLTDGEVVGDVLAACGMGEVHDDHVSACSARFVVQCAAGARPLAVVFLSERGHDLARLAGLHEGSFFCPLGWSAKTAVHLWSGAASHAALGRLLGNSLALAPHPVASGALAADLLAVLGRHRGRGTRQLDAADWQRRRRPPLGVNDIAAHLEQKVWGAPFHPTGPWPFVVIDVDRHNALQEREFAKTMRTLQRLYPSAFFVQSSSSKGAHVYLRLPAGVTYERAALVIRAYLTFLEVRFALSPDKRLQAELTEVGDEPPRLPFGLGSSVVGSSKSMNEQVMDFVKFAKKPGGTEYSKAEAEVYRRLKLRGAWSPEHREKIRARLVDAEVARIARVVLPPGDPWTPWIKKLSTGLQKVIASGVPAFGTRTRWTRELIDALTELAEPELAEALMLHWIRTRDHVSESIAEDIGAVEAQTKNLVRDCYKKKVGVPVRAWQVAEEDIRTFIHARRSERFKWHAARRPLRHAEQVDYAVLLDAAFRVLRKFYERRRRTLSLNSRVFGSGGQKNIAVDIENVLTSGRWLRFTGAAVKGVTSRIFTLSADLWPRRPFEPCLHARP